MSSYFLYCFDIVLIQKTSALLRISKLGKPDSICYIERRRPFRPVICSPHKLKIDFAAVTLEIRKMT